MKKILINHRSALALAHDICASMIVWYLAFSLRFNFEIPTEHFDLMKKTIWLTLVVQTAFFVMFGLYRSTWRFASLLDLKRILFTIFAAGTVLALIFFLFSGGPRVPRSVLIINPILLAFVMGGSRFIYRLLREYQLFGPYLIKGEPVIIYGAGTNAISLLKDLAQSDKWKVVALLDNDEVLHGREILGVKIHGSILDLAKVANFYKVQHIIIASSTINHQERRNILEKANQIGLQVLTIPAVDDLISGRFSVSQIRRVDVEDLLGRDPVSIDTSGLNQLIANKTVLVSGAGGSIGSELCRQIVKFNPKCIVCLDISEYALYKLEQEFSNLKLSAKFIYMVGDIRHASRLDKIFANYQPRLVFHAAAYKHVPLMEIGNVSEAFDNNVLGTYLLAKASKKAKVEKFVLVSTDKAVNPANVMGATKRLAEMICQGLQDSKGTQFVVVRFGNVLGSSGSVIPKFRQQINAGGPVTVTHPNITRYFMSIPEAVQLVMQASLLGKGREIFVLDMGQPVRILDLAKDMIKLSGMSEDEIKIVFSGLRPGEKLYEELLAEEELTLPTPHKKIRIAHSERVSKKWLNDLLRWVYTISEKDEKLIKKELKSWVKGFKSSNKKL
jgi:FlaA1/EpsC-like NDP-sugar epimerase